jgi:sec-independent protein translocase protein TatA
VIDQLSPLVGPQVFPFGLGSKRREVNMIEIEFGLKLTTLPWMVAWVPGTFEIILFGLILLLLFGSSRLPSLMRNLGRSAVEFKKGMSDLPGDDEETKKLE